MKGNPLLRAGLVLGLMAVLFLPVWTVTHRHATPAATAGPTPPPETISDSGTPSLRTTILIHAAPDPGTCSVTQEGRTVLSSKDRIGPGEYRSTADLRKGSDLVISASWKDGDPHALRVEVLVHGYQAPLEKDYWAQESLEDTFPIPDSFLPVPQS